MNFAPFAFQQQLITAPGPTPIIQSGLTINLDANDSISYPGTGATWFDLTTNDNDATLFNSPTFNVGTPDFFQFDGTNDFGTFGTNTIGSNTSSYTFGGWVRPRTGTTEQMIFTRGEDGSGSGWSMMLNKRPSINNIRVAVVADGSEVSANAPTNFLNDVWYQYYGVWTPGSSLKLYINGVLVATTNTTRVTLRSSTVGWRMGRYRASLPLFWRGGISTFNLYNRSLSDAEILSNFNTQKSMYGY